MRKWVRSHGLDMGITSEWKNRAENPKLLDLGTGTGRHARYFAQNGFNVSAVDIDPVALNRAKRYARFANMDIKFQLGDMKNLPYSDNSFNYVYADCILYLTDTSGMMKALDEIHRVMVPGGQAYATFNSKESMAFYGEKIDENSVLRQVQFGDNYGPFCFIDSDMWPTMFKKFEMVGFMHRRDRYAFIIEKPNAR